MLEMRASFWCLFGGMFVDKKDTQNCIKKMQKMQGIQEASLASWFSKGCVFKYSLLFLFQLVSPALHS